VSTFIHRVALRNYRSIRACDVALGPLTYVVGPNGAGKSNFLDALRLIADSLRTSLDHALRERGGIQEVRRRSAGHPTHMAVRVDFRLVGADGAPTHGHFAFEVGAKRGGGFVVSHEECRVGEAEYRVSAGTVEKPPHAVAPPAVDDRLYLVAAAGLPAFRPVFDALSNMGFYSLSPDAMRALQAPDAGEVLKRDGSNLASVLERLPPSVLERIHSYLECVVPGIEGVEPHRLGHMQTFAFRQRVAGAKDPWRFPAINMSDGTLRALGILTAVSQSAAVRFVAVEEPEIALHPAAAAVLRDCLREASRHTQVAVTSHSPDLLDDASIGADELLAVSMDEGATTLGPLDAAGRQVLAEKLYTPGELLRIGQLTPGPVDGAAPHQLELFEVLP
jgi:predicted ATPase